MITKKIEIILSIFYWLKTGQIINLIKPYEIEYKDIKILHKIPVKSSDSDIFISSYKKIKCVVKKCHINEIIICEVFFGILINSHPNSFFMKTYGYCFHEGIYYGVYEFLDGIMLYI